MAKVYISGPMTGLPQRNYPAFFAAAELVRQLGHEPINPAEGVTENNKPWVWYMRRALRLLLDADELWLLPGWQRSKGAIVERLIAKVLKMPIGFFSQVELDTGDPLSEIRGLMEAMDP